MQTSADRGGHQPAIRSGTYFVDNNFILPRTSLLWEYYEAKLIRERPDMMQ